MERLARFSNTLTNKSDRFWANQERTDFWLQKHLNRNSQ